MVWRVVAPPPHPRASAIADREQLWAQSSNLKWNGKGYPLDLGISTYAKPKVHTRLPEVHTRKRHLHGFGIVVWADQSVIDELVPVVEISSFPWIPFQVWILECPNSGSAWILLSSSPTEWSENIYQTTISVWIWNIIKRKIPPILTEDSICWNPLKIWRPDGSGFVDNKSIFTLSVVTDCKWILRSSAGWPDLGMAWEALGRTLQLKDLETTLICSENG